MSYPSLPILRESVAERAGGFDPVRATNGALKVRRLFSAEKTTFRIVHLLKDSERTTLETAYSTYKTANMTLAWPADGVNYTVRFAEAPNYQRNGALWIARVTLMQV